MNYFYQIFFTFLFKNLLLLMIIFNHLLSNNTDLQNFKIYIIGGYSTSINNQKTDKEVFDTTKAVFATFDLLKSTRKIKENHLFIMYGKFANFDVLQMELEENDKLAIHIIIYYGAFKKRTDNISFLFGKNNYSNRQNLNDLTFPNNLSTQWYLVEQTTNRNKAEWTSQFQKNNQSFNLVKGNFLASLSNFITNTSLLSFPDKTYLTLNDFNTHFLDNYIQPQINLGEKQQKLPLISFQFIPQKTVTNWFTVVENKVLKSKVKEKEINQNFVSFKKYIPLKKMKKVEKKKRVISRVDAYWQ